MLGGRQLPLARHDGDRMAGRNGGRFVKAVLLSGFRAVLISIPACLVKLGTPHETLFPLSSTDLIIRHLPAKCISCSVAVFWTVLTVRASPQYRRLMV